MKTRVDPLAELDEDAWPALHQLARALHVASAELEPTLDAIIAEAVSTLDPAQYAGLVLLLGGKLVLQATLGEPPEVLDSFQNQTGEGPCIDAARNQSAIVIDNTTIDSRWPRFNERAVELGLSSVLCVPLWVDRSKLGTLSLYSQEPDAFSAHHRRLAELYAAHAAIALADAQRTAQLHQALRNRDVIGQAKGILIERNKITPDAAFTCLALASQHTNMKLIAVAQHLVETGELLDSALPRRA
ncbi:MAG: response regulator with putative antiterminator output domain [Pseudonocardiales bacterium]|nr:response regulator with putative antiterminator output domain [Pseudonocardiales bacterium]